MDQLGSQIAQLGQPRTQGFLHLGRDKDPGRFLPADRHPLDDYFLAGAFVKTKGVVSKLGGGIKTALLPLLEIFHEGATHGNLVNAILRQTHPDSVSQTVEQQGADADGALDPAVLPIPCLGHAEMQRIVPVRPLLVQRGDQQSVSLDHHLRVGGLHREDKVVEVQLSGDPGELEGAFHHPVGGIPITVHDPVRERAVVRADPQGELALLQDLHQRGEGLLNPGQLLPVLVVGILAHGELLLVGKITRIDADLVDPLSGLHRRIRLEMDVRHDRDITASSEELLLDVLEVGSVLHRRRGDPDELAAHFDEIQRLLHRSGRIHRVAGDHALHDDRVWSPDTHLAYPHLPGGPAGVAKGTGTVPGHFFSGAGRKIGISVDSAGLSIRRLILRESW